MNTDPIADLLTRIRNANRNRAESCTVPASRLKVNILDALVITKVQVGTATPDPACGPGDANQDGIMNVIDAMMIAQCQVGIPNIACPDA